MELISLFDRLASYMTTLHTRSRGVGNSCLIEFASGAWQYRQNFHLTGVSISPLLRAAKFLANLHKPLHQDITDSQGSGQYTSALHSQD